MEKLSALLWNFFLQNTGLSGYLIIFGLYVHLFIGFSFHLYLRTFILLFIFNKEKEFYS